MVHTNGTSKGNTFLFTSESVGEVSSLVPNHTERTTDSKQRVTPTRSLTRFLMPFSMPA